MNPRVVLCPLTVLSVSIAGCRQLLFLSLAPSRLCISCLSTRAGISGCFLHAVVTMGDRALVSFKSLIELNTSSPFFNIAGTFGDPLFCAWD